MRNTRKIELCEQNDKIVGITPAMPSGSSLNIMMKEMPDRTFDVGIAEQHAVTFSAGLATQGMIPFCNIYSSFMQRAYDQLIHDVALQKLPVIFCLDRGGLVGSDGATHQGAYDLSFMRLIPNMIVSAPMDEIELRNLMYTAQLRNYGPFVIRYPRGKGVHVDWEKPFTEIPIGKGRMIRKGEKLAVLSLGTAGNLANNALHKIENDDLNPAHYDFRFAKPLDEDLLHEIFQNFSYILTIEDGSLIGGFGSAVLEFKENNNYTSRIKRLGIPDEFIEHGTQQQQYNMCGFDEDSIIQNIYSLLSNK